MFASLLCLNNELLGQDDFEINSFHLGLRVDYNPIFKGRIKNSELEFNGSAFRVGFSAKINHIYFMLGGDFVLAMSQYEETLNGAGMSMAVGYIFRDDNQFKIPIHLIFSSLGLKDEGNTTKGLSNLGFEVSPRFYITNRFALAGNIGIWSSSHVKENGSEIDNPNTGSLINAGFGIYYTLK